jgi:hypothetical protein
MSRRNNQVKTYLTDKENAKLERWAEKVDKSKSELLRQAVLEYTDRDRVERVESEVRDLNDKVERVLSLVDGQHTHTRGNKSIPEKTREVAQTLYKNHDMPVKDTDVELTIENIAGGDDRTVEQYKEQLKKRELLFKHPNSTVWTDDKQQWVNWVENAYLDPDVHEVTQDYGMSTTEYIEVAEEIEQ